MDGDASTARSDDLTKLLALLTLSDGRLAADLGVSTGTVRSWRTGRRNPSPGNCRLLVEVARNHALSILRLTRDMGGEPTSPSASASVTADLIELRRNLQVNGNRVASLHKQLSETARLLRRGA